MKFTVENETALRAGFAIKDLPMTFRHAIQSTRALSVKYLWIDSLCILQKLCRRQDIPKCFNGRDVQEPFLGRGSIAATSSPNSEGGIFAEREPHLLKPLNLTRKWKSRGGLTRQDNIFQTRDCGIVLWAYYRGGHLGRDFWYRQHHGEGFEGPVHWWIVEKYTLEDLLWRVDPAQNYNVPLQCDYSNNGHRLGPMPQWKGKHTDGDRLGGEMLFQKRPMFSCSKLWISNRLRYSGRNGQIKSGYLSILGLFFRLGIAGGMPSKHNLSVKIGNYNCYVNMNIDGRDAWYSKEKPGANLLCMPIFLTRFGSITLHGLISEPAPLWISGETPRKNWRLQLLHLG